MLRPARQLLRDQTRGLREHLARHPGDHGVLAGFGDVAPSMKRGRSDVLSRCALVAGLAAVYFAAAKLGLKLAFLHSSATAVWPPSGIALAAFLLLGYRRVCPPRLSGGLLLVPSVLPITLF